MPSRELFWFGLLSAGVVAIACGGPSGATPAPHVVVVPEASASPSARVWRPMTAASSASLRRSSGWRGRLEGCTPDAIDKYQARAQFQRAMVAYHGDDYAKALELFTQLYQQTCTLQVLYNLATTLERTGERDAAADVLDLYLEREPGSSRRAEIRAQIEALRGPP